MPLQIPVTQTGLEASIQQAMKNAGRNAQINLGTNSRQINALSQPLGRITGQADEFTKSMEAANARVFAFGASVGIINGVSKAFAALVRNTIEVEKSLVEINTVLEASSDSLQKFGNKLFDVAKTTGQTFDVVAKGALELARQGLSTEETLKRINDALILSRLSGLDAQQSVEGLTAAFNSFQETGITTSQILNKLVVVSQKYAVSERDLIEGLKRSASVADQAGVSFDELVGIITTVQERTARGGAVIGNAFKTIFARIQDRGALEDLASFGVQITDLQGKILPATQILQNLALEFNNLSQTEQADLAKKLGGVYQLSNLLAAVKDLSSEQSKYVDIVKLSAGATDEAYKKNAALNETLAALINKVTVSAQQLGATLGEIGISDSLKSLLSFFNNILEGIQNILGEEGALGDMFRGLAKGIGSVLAGPGLVLFGAIIGKLSIQLAKFGVEALKSFFKIGESARQIESVEKAIAAALGSNLGLQRQLFALEGNRAAQIKLMTDAIVQQEAVMRRMAATAGSLAAPLYQQGVRSTGGQGLRVPKAAGGYMPAVSGEASDIRRGVGGARAGDRPVVIPNFAFGGGKKGTMVAHTGEYIVPNFARGGSAIFNRDMIASMGLPSGAQKIGSAGGFIPNFANIATETSRVNLNSIIANRSGKRSAADVAAAKKRLAELENKKLPLNQLSKINPNGRDFGMIVGQKGTSTQVSRFADDQGRITSTQTAGSKFLIDVPIYRIQDKNLKFKESKTINEQLSNISAKTALKMAKDLSGGQLPNPDNVQLIKTLLNPGALAGTAGAIFEAGIAGILKDDDFKDYEAMARNTLIDFKPYGRIKELFNIPSSQASKGLEAKATDADSLISSSAGKFHKNFKGLAAFSTKKASKGYIPNFANPLAEAIDREMSAGVPASQNYEDPNSSLKNYMNPM
jgi:TP901 family phage tail tape measure protein